MILHSAALVWKGLRLAKSTRSQAAVFLQALEMGVDRAASVAVGLATFFHVNVGPHSQSGLLVAWSSAATPARSWRMRVVLAVNVA